MSEDQQQPEPFQFTEEELAAAEERREKKRADAAARRPVAEPVPAAETLSAMIARLQSMSEVAERERRSLPCYELTEAGELGAAADRCRATEAFRGDRDARGGDLGCRWRQHGEWCALERQGEAMRMATERLRAAAAPKRPADRILASIPGAPDRRTLADTESLRAARAFVAAPKAAGLLLDSGVRVPFMGSEWLLVLAGPPGTGKTIAAAYALARVGGHWLSARNLANPKFDISAAERADLLVLDDLGGEYSGASSFGPDRAAALLEMRHEEERRTIITTNLKEPDLAARYGARLASRLKEQGRFIACVGADMRGAA